MNHFAGHTRPEPTSAINDEHKVVWYDASAPGHPSVRFFARISQLGSWREEFALRTALLRALSSGKAETDFHACSARHKDKTQHYPTLTYWPRLDGTVTHLDVVFPDTSGKPPLAIHGSASNGGRSTGVPLTGRIIKSWEPRLGDYSTWLGLRPDSVPYGLGPDPVFMPNVMDVSHKFGTVCFESYPAGLGYYHKPDGDLLWLGYADEASQGAPQVDRSHDCITATWIAKSNWVATFTSARIGILTGSAMGFIDGYSFRSTVRQVPGGPAQAQRKTISWAVSPGVPIVSIKVDDRYSHKRAMAGRPWAVALNALSEVFVLCELPDLRQLCADNPWSAARTACWQLVMPTRRTPRLDNLDSFQESNISKVAKERAFSPGPAPFPANHDSPEQNNQIQEFCTLLPSHFRETCHGWDMRRRLEVDFAGGDDEGSMEHIFVITCGHAPDIPPGVRRFTAVRCWPSVASQKEIEVTTASIFGGPGPESILLSGGSMTPTVVGSGTEWLIDNLCLNGHDGEVMTASALDTSTVALLTPSEENLDLGFVTSTLLPGRRGRWFCIGTDSGALLVWNGRFDHRRGRDEAFPIRIIQTDSPSISCIATTALCVIHGGSDGRLHAWDPLGSTMGPVRVLNGKQGNGPVRTLNMHHLMHNNDPAITAIHLDPDPTKLRGLAASGRVVRCWSYSAAHRVRGRKKRRFSRIHGRCGGRLSHRVANFIDAEEAELKREHREAERQKKYLQTRFLLADLTEEEAIMYAQLLSEETAQQYELHRAMDQENFTSASDDVSTNETESEALSVYISNDHNPELASTSSLVVPLTSGGPSHSLDIESDTSAKEMELAMRLSLQEVQDQVGESSGAANTSDLPGTNSDAGDTLIPMGDGEVDGILASISAEEDFELKMALIASLQESRRTSQEKFVSNWPSGNPQSMTPIRKLDEDEELQLALNLSLQTDHDINMNKGKSAASLVGSVSEYAYSFKSFQCDNKLTLSSPNRAVKGKGKKGKWVKWSP